MHAEFVLHLQTPNRSYHSYINNGINNNNECCKGLILDWTLQAIKAVSFEAL